jgi:hypothetical protein
MLESHEPMERSTPPVRRFPTITPCRHLYNGVQFKLIAKLYSVQDPTSTQWPLFEGLTCLPPSLRNGSNSCTLGGYASYYVNVTNVAQIQLALNFARNANLRLVVRNTGHDFADKSIGAGALSIWTHNLKDLKYFPDYKYDSYEGPAFQLAAGVETEEVYRLAEQIGVTAVGGECRVRFLSAIPYAFCEVLTYNHRQLVLLEAISLAEATLPCPVW